MPTPLEIILRRMIAATGPVSLAQYMHLCHAHPDHGYYATGNPLGREGDYITAPEISQMFGELIASWAIDTWHQLGQPSPFQIAEPGPGRGTLMADFLRTAKADPAFNRAIQIALIEISQSLQSAQKSNLPGDLHRVSWFETIEQLPRIPTLFIANEFFDAIPFRQFIKTNDGWQENCVGLDRNDNLIFQPGDTMLDENILPPTQEQIAIGTIFEYAPAREALMDMLAIHIKNNGGAGLLIDYGHTHSGFGDSFQAVKSHTSVSPLETPGQCDLTSHVDFQALVNIAKYNELHTCPILTQGEFLLKMGLLERAGRLGGGKSAEQQQQIQRDAERLAADDQMGNLFKVFCFSNPKLKIPPFDN